MKEVDKEKIKEFIELIKPRCPYCGADTTYAYYSSFNNERYCPNCMQSLKRDD